jgi:hypothetical protein
LFLGGVAYRSRCSLWNCSCGMVNKSSQTQTGPPRYRYRSFRKIHPCLWIEGVGGQWRKLKGLRVPENSPGASLTSQEGTTAQQGLLAIFGNGVRVGHPWGSVLALESQTPKHKENPQRGAWGLRGLEFPRCWLNYGA